MRKSNYDKEPCVAIQGFDNQAFSGYGDVSLELSRNIKYLRFKKNILTIDCYPGVRIDEIVCGLKEIIKFDYVFYSDNYALSGEEITNKIQRNLTDDRVFGVISHHRMIEFFDDTKMKSIKDKINAISSGTILIIGVGASLIYLPTVLIYADLARWEIQARYRSRELANWKMDNYNEDVLKKYKRGFFVEWRVADRHKKSLFNGIDYLLDTNIKDLPKMITAEAYLFGLEKCVKQPFRVVPFFDPGVWGGQWMKNVCDLDKSKDNYAWCFDCVPEENSLYLKYSDVRIEIPSINLVFRKPTELLGDKVHARFGTEFPIRFDFLDTIEGQNLSLQVHPLTEYIQETFGMNYTQDESYYMLDVDENACVYLGVKEGINPQEMINKLKIAETGNAPFEVTNYVNRFPAKKHDHFLIPAGTIHCSGAGSMVLEISATPYIFTFKLWDWGRVGLDGLPRPINIEHGKNVIDYKRDTLWVKDNLINQVTEISRGDGWIEEKTGLHDREFIETRRHWFSKKVLHKTNESVNVLNLIEGEEALVESPNRLFEPFIVHYAETFIIPENIGEYTIKPYGKSEGETIATLKAFVRV